MTLKDECMGETLQDRVQNTGNKRKKSYSVKKKLLLN